MESEFLLVWVPTACLHLAALGVTLSFVNRENVSGEREPGTGPCLSDHTEQSSVEGHGSAPTLPLLFV